MMEYYERATAQKIFEEAFTWLWYHVLHDVWESRENSFLPGYQLFELTDWLHVDVRSEINRQKLHAGFAAGLRFHGFSEKWLQEEDAFYAEAMSDRFDTLRCKLLMGEYQHGEYYYVNYVPDDVRCVTKIFALL
jgi:hypothetical protein